MIKLKKLQQTIPDFNIFSNKDGLLEIHTEDGRRMATQRKHTSIFVIDGSQAGSDELGMKLSTSGFETEMDNPPRRPAKALGWGQASGFVMSLKGKTGTGETLTRLEFNHDSSKLLIWTSNYDVAQKLMQKFINERRAEMSGSFNKSFQVIIPTSLSLTPSEFVDLL